jgi:hypothetical protein
MKNFYEWLESTNTVPFSSLGINDLYHKGNIDNIEQINPFRLSGKQQKKGRNYAGFYVGPIEHASLYDGNLYKIIIDPKAKVLIKKGNTDRVSLEELKRYYAMGIDMIWGKDIRGLYQGIIINKNSIIRIEK